MEPNLYDGSVEGQTYSWKCDVTGSKILVEMDPWISALTTSQLMQFAFGMNYYKHILVAEGAVHIVSYGM